VPYRDVRDRWVGAEQRQPDAGADIADVTDNANRSYYQSFADVTAAVKAGGMGDWAATGSVFKNSFGTDAKSFGAAPLLDGINRLTASTGSDQYLIGVVTLTTTPR